MSFRTAWQVGVCVVLCGGLASCQKPASNAPPPPTVNALESLKKLGAGLEPDDPTPERPLREIDLNRSELNDSVMALFGQYPKLEVLRVRNTAITSKALPVLKNLTALKKLDLSETKIGNEGLDALANLTRLNALILNGTGISDVALEHVKGLKELKVLELAKTGVGDAGMKNLADLVALEELRLDGTQVSDVGLEHLKNLKKLQSIYLDGSRVTVNGLDWIRKNLPDTRIVR